MTDQALYDNWANFMEENAPTSDRHRTTLEEDIGWQAAPMLKGLVLGYEYSGEERWLSHFTRQADEMFARLEVEDGHPGWGHSITGEALVLEPVLHFVGLAQHDGKMPEAYRKKAAEYLGIVDPDLILKWEHMGRWQETHLNCGTFTEGISLPHNKNAHVGMMLLLASKVTPCEARRRNYLGKATKLARRWHKFLKVKDGDRYIWHYWDAAGWWDFDEKGQSKHWTSLEHRGYGYADTAFVAMAYDFGLVFDRTDIEMHCRTFLEEIWNGDETSPEFRPTGWFNPEYATSSIYAELARFSPKILDLVAQQLGREPTSWGAQSGIPAYLLARRRGEDFEQHHAAFTHDVLPASDTGKLGLAG